MAALLAAFLPSLAQQVRYTVCGTSTDNDKKVYLIDRLTDKAVDSTVVTDGKFAFSGSAQKDALMAVRMERKKWSNPAKAESSHIAVGEANMGSPLFVTLL